MIEGPSHVGFGGQMDVGMLLGEVEIPREVVEGHAVRGGGREDDEGLSSTDARKRRRRRRRRRGGRSEEGSRRRWTEAEAYATAKESDSIVAKQCRCSHHRVWIVRFVGR